MRIAIVEDRPEDRERLSHLLAEDARGRGWTYTVEAYASGESFLAEAERQRLIIVVDNTAPTPPREREGGFLSSRHDGLGIGTQSVRDITARYGGVAELKWENGIFYAAVMLNP